MRLIDADALMKTLGITDMDCVKCAWYSKAYRQCKRGGDFEDACTAIEDAPTIEPQRGKWIDGHRMSFDGTFHWYRMCSECDYERDDDNIDMDTNFCPNCGAWMGGQDETN